MRLKLVHQLSLLLASAALLAVLAISAVVWWNLKEGFSDYIRARDSAQLDRLAQIIASKSSDDPELEWLRGSRAGMESLLTEFRGFERPRPLESRPPPPEGRPLGDGRRPGPRPNQPNRPSSPDSIEGWIQIYSPQGEWFAGRPQTGKPSMLHPVKLHGHFIAEIRLFRNPQPSSIDIQFLARQYMGLALAGAAALLISLLLGWLVARRWALPLKTLQRATQQVAAGDLTVRTEPTGAHEIAQLMGDVNAMATALDRLQSARRLWIAQISHELRTPLSVLRGELEAVQDGAREPSAELIRNLLDEVLQLGRLVGDLHTLSMADLGQLHCAFAKHNAAPELTRMAQRYAELAKAKGLQLSVNPSPVTSDPVFVLWDMQRITQVLTNLLSNSLRYTDAPGRIVLQWQVIDHHCVLTLDDSAPSVPAEAIDQLFEPLYRADVARQRQAGHADGSGLGLAIARAITVAHGGTIAASHSPLGGISIKLTLPLEPKEALA